MWLENVNIRYDKSVIISQDFLTFYESDYAEKTEKRIAALENKIWH